jgi:hypothetical protein
MPLQRGEILGYDFNRMVVEFTMFNQGAIAWPVYLHSGAEIFDDAMKRLEFVNGVSGALSWYVSNRRFQAKASNVPRTAEGPAQGPYATEQQICFTEQRIVAAEQKIAKLRLRPANALMMSRHTPSWRQRGRSGTSRRRTRARGARCDRSPCGRIRCRPGQKRCALGLAVQRSARLRLCRANYGQSVRISVRSHRMRLQGSEPNG